MDLPTPPLTQTLDLYDTLEYRLRTNDRDLLSLLSRSTERLALVRVARVILSDRERPLRIPCAASSCETSATTANVCDDSGFSRTSCVGR